MATSYAPLPTVTAAHLEYESRLYHSLLEGTQARYLCIPRHLLTLIHNFFQGLARHNSAGNRHLNLNKF